ncbi:HNH endonuclease [Pararhizobium sp.]|uniref:HNH endonuclease n=1 Tax=Pararhizobium sp. TaxID=1977563 RepID=UPI003D0988E1
MVISDYHRAFVEKFERDDVTAKHLHGLRKRKGWKVGRAPGRFKGRRLRYSVEEIAWLQQNCTMETGAYHAAFCKKFGRKDVTVSMLIGLRKREGWKTGRSGRYEKGSVPANKGKKMPYNPNTARTQFKKGNQPHNTNFLGHERVGSDGYVWVSVQQTNPYTGADRSYVQKHKWLWEKQNGPVPKDHCLKCLDGDKQNTDPSNWDLVPRAILPRLNGINGRGYEEAPAELKPIILTTSKLEHAAREAGKKRKRTRRNQTEMESQS